MRLLVTDASLPLEPHGAPKQHDAAHTDVRNPPGRRCWKASCTLAPLKLVKGSGMTSPEATPSLTSLCSSATCEAGLASADSTHQPSRLSAATVD